MSSMPNTTPLGGMSRPTFASNPGGTILEGVPSEYWSNPVGYIRAATPPMPVSRNPEYETRNGAPVPLHAEELIDRAIKEVGLKRLVIFKDLILHGNKFNVPDWLGVMAVRWQREGLIGNPQWSMLPGTQSENFMPDLDLLSLPMSCLSIGFNIHPRLFEEWLRYGTPLDLRIVRQATRRMNEYLETAILWGIPVQSGGTSAPGLLNAPHTTGIPLSGGLSWYDPAKTGQQIVGDISTFIDTLNANAHYEPAWLYVGTKTGNHLQTTDYKTANAASSQTIWEHLAAMPSIEKIAISDYLPQDNPLMFIPDKDSVIDILDGQMPTQLSWLTGPTGLQTRNFMMLASEVPRVIESQQNQSGIVYGKLQQSDVLVSPWSANGVVPVG